MTEYSEGPSPRRERSGTGPTHAQAAVKESLGRGSAVRVQNTHQGKDVARTSEWGAEKRLEKHFKNESGPTRLEMDLLFSEHKSTVAEYRRSGFTDQQIYDLLENPRQ